MSQKLRNNMIAIQRAKGIFDVRWIKYCEDHNIDYKIVDCHRSDIIRQLKGCKGFLWQFYQGHPKDVLMAKQLMFSLEHAGIQVFPNFKTAWHFDDKVAQKYLLEAFELPLVSSWVFYEKAEAMDWIEKTTFPKVFKLRGGASSQNVRLVKSRKHALKLIKQAYGRGFPQYNPMGDLKERYRLYRLGKTSGFDILKGIIRFAVPPKYAKIMGHDRGYIYFQEFIPDNDHDIRIIVIGDKAFAIKRMVRKNDFRASGSGSILYEKDHFDDNTVRLSFNIAKKLGTQCIALDFVKKEEESLLVEISYGFAPLVYDPCTGYWDRDLNWHEGKFDPYGWMIDDLLKSIELSG
jgi:hypothetical protein